jgi:cytochrome c peroxidase
MAMDKSLYCGGFAFAPRVTRRLAAALALLACGPPGSTAAGGALQPATTPAHVGAPYAPLPGGRPRPPAADLAALGRALFFDPALSASGRVSCASCHDPAHAYGPPGAPAVQPGAGLGASAFRAVPSLRYLQTVPPFDAHFHDDDGDDSIDAGPAGGRMWDGRARSAHEQAALPLLSPAEMGNASRAVVAARLRRSPHAAALRALFGDGLYADADAAFDAAAMALEVFQQSPRDFAPYSSRYDEVLRGRASLTVQEARGLALFDDPARGNCASCHPSAVGAGGAFPLFTDFGHVALGVPRHRGLAANADPSFHDLGLCGPLRIDFAGRADYCGRFRTPTLRNVALRQRFFHNGVFGSLAEVLRFYVQRDIDPARWYGRDASGRARRFDDLPAAYHGNVSTEPPFLAPGAAPPPRPALDDAEIGDVIAFLRTLTDADLLPPSPAAKR